MERGSPEGGALRHVSSFIPGQEEADITAPAGEGRFSTCSATAQPMRHCHHPEPLLSFNGLSLKAAPPNFLLFSIKQGKVRFLFLLCSPDLPMVSP